MQTFKQWVREATGGQSLRQMAEVLADSHPTIGRRINANDPTLVPEIAQAYGADPIDGLIACNFITTSDLENHWKRSNLRSYTDLELAEEIVRRLQEAGTTADNR